jgi:hypothetical protein
MNFFRSQKVLNSFLLNYRSIALVSWIDFWRQACGVASPDIWQSVAWAFRAVEWRHDDIQTFGFLPLVLVDPGASIPSLAIRFSVSWKNTAMSCLACRPGAVWSAP